MRWQSRSDMKGSAIGSFGFSPSASGDMERGRGRNEGVVGWDDFVGCMWMWMGVRIMG